MVRSVTLKVLQQFSGLREHADEQNSLPLPRATLWMGAEVLTYKAYIVPPHWEDFLDYETSSFSLTFYFLSLVSLLSFQVIFCSQEEILTTFFKFSSYFPPYFNILIIIFLLIKSSHCTSAVFYPS